MNLFAINTATRIRTAPKHRSIEDGLRVQLRNLLQERDLLQEEVRQLRASVQLYAEVVRRLEPPAA
jgi:plasmid stability protein